MYSLPMAIVDFIPVLFFAAASVLLQHDLYDRMSKGVFAIFAAGTIDVILAGFLKALYKLLYAIGVCDFEPLTQMFFPVQALGFLMAGLAVARVAFLQHRQQRLVSIALAPVVFKGTFIFVGLMVLGLGAMSAGLSKYAIKKGKPIAVLMFILSFVFSLAMGYMASKDFTTDYMNWIAEAVNIIGQGSMFFGALILHRAEKINKELKTA